MRYSETDQPPGYHNLFTSPQKLYSRPVEFCPAFDMLTMEICQMTRATEPAECYPEGSLTTIHSPLLSLPIGSLDTGILIGNDLRLEIVSTYRKQTRATGSNR